MGNNTTLRTGTHQWDFGARNQANSVVAITYRNGLTPNLALTSRRSG